MTGYERIHWLYERLKRKTFPRRAQFLDCFAVSASTFKRDLAQLRDRLHTPIDYDPAAKAISSPIPIYFIAVAFDIPSPPGRGWREAPGEGAPEAILYSN